MPIGYQEATIGGEPGACPVVFCDWCDGRIEAGDGGNVFWHSDRPTVLYFDHKRCAAAGHDARLEDTAPEGVCS